MAEILIKAIDATNSDPELDNGCYKTGDVVVIMPDGHNWGKEEGAPKFYILKVPGLDVEEAKKKYMVPHVVPNGVKPNGEPILKMEKRRLYNIDLAAIKNKGSMSVDVKVAQTVSLADLEASAVNVLTSETVATEKADAEPSLE